MTGNKTVLGSKRGSIILLSVGHFYFYFNETLHKQTHTARDVLTCRQPVLPKKKKENKHSIWDNTQYFFFPYMIFMHQTVGFRHTVFTNSSLVEALNTSGSPENTYHQRGVRLRVQIRGGGTSLLRSPRRSPWIFYVFCYQTVGFRRSTAFTNSSHFDAVGTSACWKPRIISVTGLGGCGFKSEVGGNIIQGVTSPRIRWARFRPLLTA